MILLEEVLLFGNTTYIKYLVEEDNNKKILNKVQITGQILKNENNSKRMILYNSEKKVISSVYQFLNYYLKDQSYSTKEQSLMALRLLYSFIELFNINEEDLSMQEVSQLKSFLYGNSIRGQHISMTLKNKRSVDTVNMYLGVYRKYFEFIGVKDSIFHQKDIIRQVKSTTGLLGHARHSQNESYSVNDRTRNSNIVPMYIKPEEFQQILNLIRDKYSVREEIIVRLMFECGMRLGEVLGLTLEDIETDPMDLLRKDIEDLGLIVLRNRVTDKKHQLAKTCFTPSSQEDYRTSMYRTLNYGYQKVRPSIGLLTKLDEYIEDYHGNLSSKVRDNYLEKAKADKVTNGEYLQTNNNYYVFLSKNGTPLTRTGWNNIIKEIFKEVGVAVDIQTRKNNLNHRFRHGYAMFLKKYQNISELDLMYALRHSSLSAVSCYFNPDEDDIHAANSQAAQSMFELIPALQEV